MGRCAGTEARPKTRVRRSPQTWQKALNADRRSRALSGGVDPCMRQARAIALANERDSGETRTAMKGQTRRSGTHPTHHAFVLRPHVLQLQGTLLPRFGVDGVVYSLIHCDQPGHLSALECTGGCHQGRNIRATTAVTEAEQHSSVPKPQDSQARNGDGSSWKRE